MSQFESDPSLAKMHLEILHLKVLPSKKIDLHDDRATTESTNRRRRSSIASLVKDKMKEKEKPINYDYLLSDKKVKKIKKFNPKEQKQSSDRRDYFGEKIVVEDDADFTKLNLDNISKFYFCSYEKCEEFCDWYNSTIKNIDINGLSDDRGNPVRKRRTRN